MLDGDLCAAETNEAFGATPAPGAIKSKLAAEVTFDRMAHAPLDLEGAAGTLARAEPRSHRRGRRPHA